MFTLTYYDKEKHESQFREILWDYMKEINREAARHFGWQWDIENAFKEDMKKIDKYLPPDAQICIAVAAEKLIGMGCLKKLKSDICELKRFYVRPEFRKRGVARAILKQLIDDARKAGYSTIRLDSMKSLKPAHTLYQSEGFEFRETYEGCESSGSVKDHESYIIFMERRL